MLLSSALVLSSEVRRLPRQGGMREEYGTPDTRPAVELGEAAARASEFILKENGHVSLSRD